MPYCNFKMKQNEQISLRHAIRMCESVLLTRANFMSSLRNSDLFA